METKEINLNPENIDAALAQQASAILANGGVVAFPTETVYGLGANALDETAVKKIFIAKGRPSDNPLIVHIADEQDVVPLVKEISEKAKLLMQHFWPGPISIIMQKSDKISDYVSAGLSTVAIRMPQNPVAREIIRCAGVPIAAPSANTSGKPSPTEASHVREDMLGKIDMIVDGGSCDVGLESTVIDMTADIPTVLRPGGITLDMLEAVLGEVRAGKGSATQDEAPKSPGMKYKHYAPKAEVTVLEYKTDCIDALTDLVAQAQKEGYKVGILTDDKSYSACNADFYIDGGKTAEEYASNLFDALRNFDALCADKIFAPLCWQTPMMVAVRNRIYKAAGNRVMYTEEK